LVPQGKVFQPKFDRGLKQGGQHAQQRKQLLTGRPQEQITLDQPQSLQNFRNILEGQSQQNGQTIGFFAIGSARKRIEIDQSP
jgi:hypothetical protein